MLYHSGYLTVPNDITLSSSSNLLVNACGHVRLDTVHEFATERPVGREDYQLIYVAHGQGTFHLHGSSHILKEGQGILYTPHIPQSYHYRLQDHPDIYWIHFHALHPSPQLHDLNFEEPQIFDFGSHLDIFFYFDTIIMELQQKRTDYSSLCNAYATTLFTLLHRYCFEEKEGQSKRQRAFDDLLIDMNEHFCDDIPIEDYASRHHMSTCWLIRHFGELYQTTPRQYIIGLRIDKGKELLRSTDLSIAEIAGVVGYHNPLYFSRIFSKVTGMAPSTYRKEVEKQRL